MSDKGMRELHRLKIDEMYAAVEHAKNEEIALEAIRIARYWLTKAEHQAMQIQNLERRNKREGIDCDTCVHYGEGWESEYCDSCFGNHSNYERAER